MERHKFRLVILLALVVLIPGQQNTFAAKKPRHQERTDYYSPCWAPDSKHIIYIKKITYSKLRYDWLAEITKSTDMITGRDFCICKMDIETEKEEIIRKFRIKEWYSASAKYKSGWRAAWISKEDKTIFGDDYLEAKFISGISVDKISGDILIVYKISELYLLRKDGSKVIKILKCRSRVSNPCWSPNGKQILYQIDKSVDGKHVFELWLVNVDCTNNHLLVKNASHGIWHPSRKKIIFYRYKENGSTYILNLETKEKKRIAKNTSYPLDWSPNGKQRSVGSGITKVNGKSIYLKTGIRHEKWSPDGKKLLGKPMKKGSIGIFDINSKELKILTTNKSIKY